MMKGVVVVLSLLTAASWLSSTAVNAFAFQPRKMWMKAFPKTSPGVTAAGGSILIGGSPTSINTPPAANAATETSLRVATGSAWDALEQKLLSGDVATTTTASVLTSTRAAPPPTAAALDTTSAADMLSDLLKTTVASESLSAGTTSAVTAATKQVAAASAAAAIASIPAVPLVVSTSSASSVAVDPTVVTASPPSSFLDQTAANAQSVLDSVRELSSFRATTVGIDGDVTATAAANSYPDVVVMEQFRTVQEQAGTTANIHAYSLDQLEETVRNLLQGAPPGEGLAKPIVDYVMNTLYELRDSPYNPPNFIRHDDMPNTFVTTVGGVQVKQQFVQAFADARAATVATAADTKSRWADVERLIADRLNESYDSGDPVRSSIVEAVKTSLATTEATIGDTLRANYAAYGPLRSSIVDTLQSTPSVAARQYEALATKLTAPSSREPLASASANILGAWKVSLDQLAVVQTDLQRLVRTPDWRPEDVLATLNMKELGPFYVGVALAMLLAVSYTTQRLNDVTPTETTALPSSNNATPKAAASSKANQPSRTGTPQLAYAGGGMGEQAQLENIVADLTQATAILATEMKGMAAELRQLKQQQQLQQQPPPIAAAASQQPPKPAAPMMAASQAAVDKAEDELAKMLRELEVQNELLRVQLNTAQFETDTLSEVNEALAAGAEALASIAATKGPVASQAFPSMEELGLADAYFVTGFNGINGLQQTETQSVRIGTAPLKQTAVMDAPDWSNLSLSALKRKTEAELREFLASKGRSQQSKGLNKADLLALVMDIA